jgi:hypothetical protein
MKSNYNHQMIIFFQHEPWKKTMNPRIYISPCGNYRIKRSAGRLYSGKDNRTELFTLDKNENWQHVGYYADTPEAKSAAGYKEKYVSASGVALNDAGIKEYLARKEAA